IIEAKEKINKIRETVEISNRLSKTIEISRASDVDTGMEEKWEDMIAELETAKSVDEVLSIVSEFEESI
ncbi:MAG: hypothetical protein GWO20_07850, partial [Candidatus Korarchaeota archaeon]|nr:hypothetical protein [Candidatus Korarchaeota archaeon]NIU83044.1 hypothetical protein [Candidatus Thorarchaeota archaeon]